jgi:octaprenyl-diphosphate synthase
MKTDIHSVQKEFQLELDHFSKEMDILLQSDVPLLKILLKYVFKKRGKQIRPLFVLLSSGMCGQLNEQAYRAAALIELLHTATLVHDDVVDEADRRRGLFTVSAVWKNKAAVLLGDYLLARGLLVALDNNYFELLKIVSEATRQMSEGELLQMKKIRNWNLDEAMYFDIISKKTASLFGVCFKVGGHIGKTDEESMDMLYHIGIYTGITFQIKDDLIDFYSGNGKKQHFTDLKEQKLTLPVIHALQQSNFLEKMKMIDQIKHIRKNVSARKEVFKWLQEKGSFEYTEMKMLDYQAKAIELLHNFPQSRYRDGIEQTIKYITERNY